MEHGWKAVATGMMATVLVAVMASFALAEDGINWKVKVKNDTQLPAVVDACATAKCSRAQIAPGEKHTFEFGARCPKGLLGYVTEKYTTIPIKSRCTDGTEDIGGMCIVTCKSSEWKIKKGDDDFYHFRKD